MKQAARLQSARAWLPTYTGRKLFQAYCKRYGVDWETTFRELEMLGVVIDPQYKAQVLQTVQQQAEQKKARKQERAEGALGWDQDEHFAFIVGYTSGGVPYGVTWEEWNLNHDTE